jgi:transposase
MLDSRVMAQLLSLPRGQGRTAADILAGMVPGPDVSLKSVEAMLERFRTEGLAVREDQRKGPPLWRAA